MKATKICKICGNEYEYCHTFRRDSIFRWQDVACCVEHGNQYFAEIAASRNETPAIESIKEPEFFEEKKDETDVIDDAIEVESTLHFSSKKKSRK